MTQKLKLDIRNDLNNFSNQYIHVSWSEDLPVL